MALQVRFLHTRPDTSVPFWWNSTETDISNYCLTIKSLAQNLGIEHSYVEAEDNLSFVSIFTVDTMLQWNKLNKKIVEQIPDMLALRKTYFTQHNHTLTLEWIDSDDNIVVYRNTKILSGELPTF